MTAEALHLSTPETLARGGGSQDVTAGKPDAPAPRQPRCAIGLVYVNPTS